MTKKMKAVFAVVERGGRRVAYRRIGTGFVNKDNSMSVYLDAYPVSGKLHVCDWQAPASQEPAVPIEPAREVLR